jgi:hypothetical protein
MNFPLKAATLALVLGSMVPAQGAPPTPVYKYENGLWWTGSTFQPRTMYSGPTGELRDRGPERVDETIDLRGGFVIPPLAEGHNHWVEPAAVDQYNACYLADGVFYVKDMGNVPLLVNQFRDRVNLPTSVDFVSAMTPFTGPGAHPVEVLDQFVQFGLLPKDWTPDYDRKGEFVVRTQQDVDERFRELLAQNPAYVKTFLLFSEEYAARLNDPSKYGNHRGMEPALLPHLVKLAHAAHLRVETHVYTAADFRSAINAGVDDIMHLPGNGANNEPEMSFDRFRLTADDATLAATHHVTVTTTLDWLADKKTEWAQRLTEQVLVPNLLLLKQHGVPILVGSDHFRRSPLSEVLELRDLKVFTNVELLNIATYATTHAIFPDRLLGKLADGYEANFLVLERNPIENLDNLRSITLRVKQGRRLTVPAAALARPGPDCVQ